MTEQLRLAVIVGSVREGRFAPTVARWFTAQAQARSDLSVDVIDLVDNDLPIGFGGKQSVLASRLHAADAFVVVTPEYNHSFPAVVKNVIDWHNQEWHAKPVGFVSYGGLSGGLRAVEQLRVVFAELHAVTIRDTVSFHGAWSRFDDNGDPIEAAESTKAATVLLDQLAWWARALKQARAIEPYAA